MSPVIEPGALFWGVIWHNLYNLVHPATKALRAMITFHVI